MTNPRSERQLLALNDTLVDVIWEVRNGGSDTANGGGFDPGRTAGMYTDGAATSATGNSPVFTSAYSFVTADEGAWIYIASGTNWQPGWYQIASVSGGAATLKAAVGEAYYACDYGGTATTLNPVYVSTVAGCSRNGTGTLSGATWSIDYSQQDGSELTYTDLESAGTGLTVSSPAKPFGKQQVGNVIVVTGGTNFNAGRYVIASVSGTTATVQGPGSTNITTGAGASGTGAMGGGLREPAFPAGFKVSGNDVFIKYNASSYAVSSSTANISNGRINDTVGNGVTNLGQWIGYDTTRTITNTDANRPTLLASVGSITMMTSSGTATRIRNMVFDCADQTNISGVVFGGGYNQMESNIERCRVTRARTYGIRLEAQSIAFECVVDDSEQGGATEGFYLGNSAAGVHAAINCYATGCYRGFRTAGSGLCINCVAVDNLNGGFYGSYASVFVNCTSYSNDTYGFEVVGYTGCSGAVINCLAASNTGKGFDDKGAEGQRLLMYNNAAYDNTGGSYSKSIYPNFNFIDSALSGQPMTNPGSGDFSLDNTANEGQLLRGTGYPQSITNTSTSSYPDRGVAQHQDTGGSSGSSPFSIGIGN